MSSSVKVRLMEIREKLRTEIENAYKAGLEQVEEQIKNATDAADAAVGEKFRDTLASNRDRDLKHFDSRLFISNA